MTRPANDLKGWATNTYHSEPGAPWDNQPNKVEPTDPKIEIGFQPNEKPWAETFNFLFAEQKNYLRYLDTPEAKNWHPIVRLGGLSTESVYNIFPAACRVTRLTDNRLACIGGDYDPTFAAYVVVSEDEGQSWQVSESSNGGGNLGWDDNLASPINTVVGAAFRPNGDVAFYGDSNGFTGGTNWTSGYADFDGSTTGGGSYVYDWGTTVSFKGCDWVEREGKFFFYGTIITAGGFAYITPDVVTPAQGVVGFGILSTCMAMAHNSTRSIAVLANGTVVYGSLATSWTAVVGAVSGTPLQNGALWWQDTQSAGLFVVLTSTGVWVSSDGSTWQQSYTVGSLSGACAALGGTLLIERRSTLVASTSATSQLLYSTDGAASFTTVLAPVQPTIFQAHGQGVGGLEASTSNPSDAAPKVVLSACGNRFAMMGRSIADSGATNAGQGIVAMGHRV